MDAQEARLKALEATVARLRRNLLRHGRIPRPPPSHRPLTSSSRPSLSRRKVRSDAVSADNLVTPSTNAPPFPRSRSTAQSVDYRLDLCPCCGHYLQPMPTILPRVIQQVDIKDVPLEVQEHRGHPGWCSHCQKQFEAPSGGFELSQTLRQKRSIADHAAKR